MNDKKQIEQLASLMADCNTTCDECFEKFESVTTMKIKEREKHCQVYAYAQRAVEQGYRKIPEDAVVLTKVEYESLRQSLTQTTVRECELADRARALLHECDVLKIDLEKARKDTAKAILNVIYFNLQNSVKGHIAKSNDYYNVMSRIQEIAKNYGVEVEE